jgi:hypothetical protein
MSGCSSESMRAVAPTSDHLFRVVRMRSRNRRAHTRRDLATARAWVLVLALLAGGVGWASLAPGHARAGPLPCGALSPCSPPTTTTTGGPAPPPGSASSQSPSQGAAVPGAEYDGHAGRMYSELVVSPSGAQIAKFVFIFPPGRCSNGEAYPNVLTIFVRRGASISAEGDTRYYSSSRHAFFVSRRGKRIHGHHQLAIVARFVGDQVSGTVRDEFRSRRFRCVNGPVSFTAFRDGTTGAPLRDQTVATGQYVGRATGEVPGQPSHPFTADVFLPWGVIRVLKFGWVLPCPGRLLREHSTFKFLPLRYLFPGSTDPVGAFNVSAHGVRKLAHGVSGRWSSNIRGTFWLSSQSRYGIDGIWTYTIVFAHKGHNFGGCGAEVNLNAAGPPREPHPE